MSEGDKFDLLAQAKAHFRELVVEKSTSFEIGEWGITIYIKPPTLAQRDAQYQRGQARRSLENAAHLLIDRALTDKGVPMFNPVELHGLLHQVDSQVLLRTSTAINQYDAKLWGLAGSEDEEAAPLTEVETAKKD